jgi:hypothetical protein
MSFNWMIYDGSQARFRRCRAGGAPSVRRVAALLFFLFGLSTGGILPAAGQAELSGDLRGTVLEVGANAPVSGAVIEIVGMGLSAMSDSRGEFAIEDIPLSENPLPVTITVDADGYGEWRIEQVLLVAEDTLILNVELESNPVLITMPPPRTDSPGTYRQEELQVALDEMIAADMTDPPLPDTIIVRVYGPPFSPCNPSRTGYDTQVIDFNYYVKHVLPNEWIYSWPGESLRAGAMAAKMYGWFWVDYPGTWDVRDDVCDQVYNPAVEYQSTNDAVDFTWNWRMTRSGTLILPHYVDGIAATCSALGWSDCIEQWATYWHALGNNGYAKLTWDEMLELYYAPIEITPAETPPLAGSMLRFYGNGWGDIDRVKIPIDPQVPADVGGAFTLEWWMKADPSENGAGGCTTGNHEAWINGNVVFDRDVFGVGDYGDYGVALAGGRIAFGINNGSSSTTVCGSIPLADNRWHHVAVVRDDAGTLSIFVDGRLDETAPGPTGDISYRDGRTTSYPNRDPFLVIGAEKHDVNPPYSSYSGFLDEVRLSNIARYSGSFSPPGEPFTSDGNTVALYHFDEGRGDTLGDSSGAAGGPSDGERRYGGDPYNGPEWFTSDLNFLTPRLYLPLIQR